MLAGSKFHQIWLGWELPQSYIFGKMRFLLMPENAFFHEIKCNGMTSFMEYMLYCKFFLQVWTTMQCGCNLKRCWCKVVWDQTWSQWVAYPFPFKFDITFLGTLVSCSSPEAYRNICLNPRTMNVINTREHCTQQHACAVTWCGSIWEVPNVPCAFINPLCQSRILSLYSLW